MNPLLTELAARELHARRQRRLDNMQRLLAASAALDAVASPTAGLHLRGLQVRVPASMTSSAAAVAACHDAA